MSEDNETVQIHLLRHKTTLPMFILMDELLYV